VKRNKDIGRIRIVHYLNAILPLIAVVAVLFAAVFLWLAPGIHKHSLESRMQETANIVRSVWSIADSVHHRFEVGLLSEEDAKSIVLDHVRSIRYGPAMEDFCWLYDTENHQLTHPHVTQEAMDAYFASTTATTIPLEHLSWMNRDEHFFSHEATREGSELLEKQTFFVKDFEPWSWKIGSGFSEDNVSDRLSELTHPVFRSTVMLLIIISLLMVLSLRRSLKAIGTVFQKDSEIQTLSSIIRDAPLSIVTTDLKGNVEYANPSTIKSYGWTEEELKGANVNLFKSGQTPKEVYDDMWETITHGNTWRGEILNRNKSGNLIWEDLLIAPIRNEKGKSGATMRSSRISPNRNNCKAHSSRQRTRPKRATV
jgi:PAS domain S-box-containing protein